jgi:hypothetical protein
MIQECARVSGVGSLSRPARTYRKGRVFTLAELLSSQRIFNVPRTPLSEIHTEVTAMLDRIAALPSRVIVPRIPLLTNQDGYGTCVAQAAYILYGHAFKTKYGRFPAIGQDQIFAFYDLCKKVDGDPDPYRFKGTWLLTALRVMRGSGFPLADGTRGPKITGYEFVGWNADDIRRSLAQQQTPVLFRIDWDYKWMSLPPSRIMNVPSGHILGGHAMASFGYDDSVAGGSDADRNSWGRWSSGGNGNCYFPYGYKNAPTAGLEAWRVNGIQ